jgi:hypothetical protein
MTRQIVTVAACLVFGGGVLARAAEGAKSAPDAIREGLSLYEKGKPGEAIQSLQKAIELIQQQQQAGVENYLPKTIAGWKAGEVEREQYAGGTGDGAAAFFKVSRTFTRPGDEAQMTVSLLNAPELIVPQKALLDGMKANPMLLQAMSQQGNVKATFVERDGWAGWRRVDQDTPESQVILLAQSWMLEVRVGIADGAVVDAAAQAVNLKAIAGAGK